MKSKGELFLSVLRADSRLTSCNVPYADLPQWAKDAYEEAAAEYDKATSQLPEDVEAFLNECAAPIPDTTDHAERIIELVRNLAKDNDNYLERYEELRARNRELKHHKASLISSCETMAKERDELRERVTQLEATIKQMEEDDHDRRMEAREEYD